jgi:hypothetical protein
MQACRWGGQQQGCLKGVACGWREAQGNLGSSQQRCQQQPV